MFGIPLGSTRAVLLVENKDKDGNVVIQATHLRLLQTTWDIDRNLFYGDSLGRVTIEAIPMGQTIWDGKMPDPEERLEIEPTQLSIESNEESVIIAELIE